MKSRLVHTRSLPLEKRDYDVGKILVTSPLAQGLLGKKPGEKVEIPAPGGTMRFEILSISFED